MGKSVLAKFCLVSITEHCNWQGKTLRFRPHYDESIPEDRRFATATPSGQVEITVDNPSALEQFEKGGFYYIEFSRAPQA